MSQFGIYCLTIAMLLYGLFLVYLIGLFLSRVEREGEFYRE